MSSTLENVQHPGKCPFSQMSVDAGWPMALPLVAGFLEMFAGVMYNREEKKRKTCLQPPRVLYGVLN